MDSHPHDPETGKARKLLGQRFMLIMDRAVTHVRLDLFDKTETIEVLGLAGVMHGPTGCCSCCPRHHRLTVDGDPVGVTP